MSQIFCHFAIYLQRIKVREGKGRGWVRLENLPDGGEAGGGGSNKIFDSTSFPPERSFERYL